MILWLFVARLLLARIFISHCFVVLGTSFWKFFCRLLFNCSSSSSNSTLFWGLQLQFLPIQQISLWIVFLHSVLEFPAAFHSCFPLTFAFVSLSVDLALQWRLRPGLHHTYRRRRRVMGPLNPGCFDCFPLACPVLASFSTSFSTYAFPFQILCLNGTRFLPNWHKFLWLIAATYISTKQLWECRVIGLAHVIQSSRQIL